MRTGVELLDFNTGKVIGTNLAQLKKPELVSPGSSIPRNLMVPKGGLEPPRVSPYAPQTYVSTNSTTSALSEVRLSNYTTLIPQIKSQSREIGHQFRAFSAPALSGPNSCSACPAARAESPRETGRERATRS